MSVSGIDYNAPTTDPADSGDETATSSGNDSSDDSSDSLNAAQAALDKSLQQLQASHEIRQQRIQARNAGVQLQWKISLCRSDILVITLALCAFASFARQFVRFGIGRT